MLTPPKLVRRFTCPTCRGIAGLDYTPARDGQLVPTMFECPHCGNGCTVDLPGQLRHVSKAEAGA